MPARWELVRRVRRNSQARSGSQCLAGFGRQVWLRYSEFRLNGGLVGSRCADLFVVIRMAIIIVTNSTHLTGSYRWWKKLVNAQGFQTQDAKYRSARSVLVVVGGLPATGKSTIAGILARQTATPYLRIDRIEQAIVAWSSLSHPLGPVGYAVAHELAREQLQLGLGGSWGC